MSTILAPLLAFVVLVNSSSCNDMVTASREYGAIPGVTQFGEL